LLIAEFEELCCIACADLKRHTAATPSRDNYWREMCNVIGDRLGIDPPALSDDYPSELAKLAEGAGLDEHEALNIARKCVEETMMRA